MRFQSSALTLAIASTLFCPCLAQNPQPTVYTDPTTGICFDVWDIPGDSKTGGMAFGMALPSTALKTDATEFIGYLNCKERQGWCGIALGGSMTDSLLFVAYADGDVVRTSLRFTHKYAAPGVYTGNATVAEIAHEVTETGISFIFHCQDCLHWSQDGGSGRASTGSSMLDLGYAQSVQDPGNPSCAREAPLMLHDAQGTWTAMLDESATSDSYDQWRALANPTVPDNC
ncbi:hypothetical protein EYZ11_005458 [Aspergillus tanneri]|uniref:Cellobiose dehydrogenase-like cytochrome domain-containing protein n=1 Tax=Aspergillus tanneri TaxID=1220188 RepID=A0A4S3JI55_9EURO|nr:hypothetical protein EYZ11_005458 [Aspergillus tanneri]